MPTETIIQNPPLLNGSPIRPMATLPEQEDAWMGVLSRKPPWVVRWGIVCFTILLLILLSMASVIRYPDRVSAQAKLMALNPPRPLPVRTGSQAPLPAI